MNKHKAGEDRTDGPCPRGGNAGRGHERPDDDGRPLIACMVRDAAVFERCRAVLEHGDWQYSRFDSDTALLRGLRRRIAALALVEIGRDSAMDERLLHWLVCRTSHTPPLLLLSSSASPHFIARALDAGAEDCIALPMHPLELRARLSAALRRSLRNDTRPMCVALSGYQLDRSSGVVMRHGVVIELAPREFAMAWLFFCNPGVCLSRETISVSLWGAPTDLTSRSMEQHAYMLRKKLDLSGHSGLVLRSIYTRGYRLESVDGVLAAESLLQDGGPGTGLVEGALIA